MSRVPLGDGAADIGNGLVSASLAQGGAWLSVGAPHGTHGFVELTGLPPFEPAWRGDPAAVRRYRGSMTEHAFLTVEGPGAAPAARTLVLDRPAFVHEQGAAHEITTRARAYEPCIEQRHRLAGSGRVVVRFHGRLDAHPLAEITDIDPPPPTGACTRLLAAGDRLLVEAPELPAAAEVRVTGGSSRGWVVSGAAAEIVVTEADELVVACRLRQAAAGRLHVPQARCTGLERLVERTRAYVLDCTAVRVGPGEICLLTDHRILPLSWTRDAYWQAALLLAHRPDRTAVDTVASHLRWLWRRCERPDRFWMRSHHSNGARKDVAFQADQQLYPLMELADFARVAGDLPSGVAWGREVVELWDALPVTELGFLSSDENAADDETEHPYPLSAQILYWLAAVRLAELGFARDFGATARALPGAIAEHFEVEGPGGRQWAYEIDGRGGHRLYHDANDLPTALAPLLGFCDAEDPVWAATMRFAFGRRNPGWCEGPFGGLGSRHTAGTWTLGDVQEWAVASLLGEPERAEGALDRLLAVAAPDGLLPEAYDPATGGSPVRRWFAWPGAALGTLLCEHGRPR